MAPHPPGLRAWTSGDIAAAWSIVDREAREIQQWPAERGRMQDYLASFYLTLGRLRDAERILRESGDRFIVSVLAEFRGDVPALRSYLSQAPPDPFVSRLVKGRIDRPGARETRE